ncbi:hypothetical protein FMJ64_28000 [Klebsiella variicola]|nr:hypothetical protein [Klebsiella variicola]
MSAPLPASLVPHGRPSCDCAPPRKRVKIRTERGKTNQKHNDACSRWLIEQADRKEKEEFSRSFNRLKGILLNIVVFGIISLGVCLAVQQVTQ